MFERFTDRARRVVVLAQDEARQLNHNYIGTEHLLLGLIHEGEGVAAQALDALGVSLETVRSEVMELIGPGRGMPRGHIPFTPRAKKVLELSLREALRLGHNYIGTEHILLGLIREGEGAAATVLGKLGVSLEGVRQQVTELLAGYQSRAAAGRRRRRLRLRSPFAPDEPEEIFTTPAGEVSLEQARRIAGEEPVGSHHLLLAALQDQHSAAARVLADLGVDLGQAREALRRVDVTGTSDEPPEEAGRRLMRIRLDGDRLVLEAGDPALLAVAGRAVEALAALPDPDGAPGGERGEIAGSRPEAAALADVWLALQGGLEELTRRARARARDLQARDAADEAAGGSGTAPGDAGGTGAAAADEG